MSQNYYYGDMSPIFIMVIWSRITVLVKGDNESFEMIVWARNIVMLMGPKTFMAFWARKLLCWYKPEILIWLYETDILSWWDKYKIELLSWGYGPEISL